MHDACLLTTRGFRRLHVVQFSRHVYKKLITGAQTPVFVVHLIVTGITLAVFSKSVSIVATLVSYPVKFVSMICV